MCPCEGVGRERSQRCVITERDLGTNYALLVTVLLRADLRRAASAFEQGAASNIQYPGVFWSLHSGWFSAPVSPEVPLQQISWVSFHAMCPQRRSKFLRQQ